MSALPPLVLCTLAVLCVLPGAAATMYNVGDSAGWDISADFDNWPIGKTFTVGDVILFQYSSYHTVNEVDKRGFDNCSTANAIQTGAGGNTTIPLTTPGDRYFICGVPSHCFGGMKLHVSVSAPPGAVAPGSAGQPTTSPTPPADGRGDSAVVFGSSSHAVRDSKYARWWGAVVGVVFWMLVPGL